MNKFLTNFNYILFFIFIIVKLNIKNSLFMVIFHILILLETKHNNSKKESKKGDMISK